MFDVVYISWFILLATALISDAFWWTYALIPAYAFFKLWTMVIAPYLRSTYGGGSTGSGPDAGESSATSRRAEKREARGQRPKFQRVH